jgi:muramoyltetrapeptide carboxypeptidase
VIRPQHLRPGDVIRVVAPSGPIPPDDFAQGAAVLSARYQLRYAPASLFRATGFTAGPDHVRLAELVAALRDPDARAVIMGRGGYGLLRIVANIEPDLLRLAARPIVGFSDGTVLLAQAARAGLASIHGPVVTQLGRLAQDDHDALFAALEQPDARPLLSGLEPLVGSRAAGPLLGGNLEVFSRLLGTPYLPDLRGAILFFEDVGERPYRIDRLLTQMELAGVFQAAAGVVMGQLIGCDEPAASRVASPSASEVARERLGRLSIPVALGAPIGHGRQNRALPYGTRVELDADAGTLVALEGAVCR